MRKFIFTLAIIALFLFGPFILTGMATQKWLGVDEIVVDKFATDAGRSTMEPFINTDQGDLLLFVFLVAGVTGGFIFGFYFRQLFPASRDRERNELK